MFDKARLQDVLVEYKKIFVPTQWEKEKYKWEAVKHFQDNWDVNATEFADMLNLALSKTNNLLASRNFLPAGMIRKFSEKVPEEVRSMFVALFDESKDVIPRIIEFKDQASILLDKYGDDAKSHYQNENAISTYLWLRYPNKYYIYKYNEVRIVAETLGSDLVFKRGAYTDNLRNFYHLYDEIHSEIRKDGELISLFKSQLTEDSYPDPEYRTLVTDIGYYIFRANSSKKQKSQYDDEWFPTDYHPNISVAEWMELIQDPEVFTTNSLEIVKRMKDYGGQATCTQLAEKYGKTHGFYNAGSSALARRIAEKTDCPLIDEEDAENARWWPILYVGRSADKDTAGIYVWKLREELSEALDRTDLSPVKLYATSPSDEGEQKYWWLNANPRVWSFSDLAVGKVQAYTLYNDNGNKRRVFQNFLDAKAGDLVIGYESTPVKQIVALARVSSEQDGEIIHFEKTEGLASPIDYQMLKNSPELEKMEYLNNPQGSFFKLTKFEYDFILDLIRDDNPLIQEKPPEPYTKQKFLKDVYMTESRYDLLCSVLKKKKNVILQGAPGVGKTFAAKRLAYSIIGAKDENRIEFVQFHQNYSYEDLMMGYKPVDDGFELKHGIFYRFCQKAANYPDKPFFFIIDEINRGNLSKIFGELLMLIERDYRGAKTTLAYNGLPFTVPENIYIIGMMNTADRSLAMIDYALRRRFSFFEMKPGFDSEGFIQYQKKLANDIFNELIEKIKQLNKEISLDKSLGKGFCIGHSYFCSEKVCSDEWMQAIVEYDILPMLSEYWFDDHDKIQRWDSLLRGVFQ